MTKEKRRPEQKGVKMLLDTASFLARSERYHLRYFRPARYPQPTIIENKAERYYVGKVESSVITMIFDMFGIKEEDIKGKPTDFFRALAAFNLMWRAYDEVVDIKQNTISPVTVEELDHTPVYHKFIERNITGIEGRGFISEAMLKVIPGEDLGSQSKRKRIEELLLNYRDRVAETANNKAYHDGDVLTFEQALGTKNDVSRLLAEVSAELCAVSLDIDDPIAIKTFGDVGMAVQFGDDLLDWKKDWQEHLDQKNANISAKVRPIENLFLATLEEFPKEKELCKVNLASSAKSVSLIKKLAPQAFALYCERFQDALKSFPEHNYTDKLKGILNFTFYKILPILPDSGLIQQFLKM